MRQTGKVDSSAVVTLGGSSRGLGPDTGNHPSHIAACRAPDGGGAGRAAQPHDPVCLQYFCIVKRFCFSKVIKKSSINFKM